MSIEPPKPRDESTEPMLPSRAVEPTPPTSAGAAAIKEAPRAMKRSMPMALSIMLGIVLASLVGWFFYRLTWFILVLYLSFVAATILEAPVYWVKRRGIRRGLAAVIVVIGGLALAGFGLYLVANAVYNQIAAVSTNLERAPDRINAMVNGLKQHFPALGKRLGDFDVAKAATDAVPTFKTVWENAMNGVEIISWSVIMFFVVLYMLIDGADHLKTMRCLLPKERRYEATKVFNSLAKAHRGWALASLLNVASSTLLTGVGLWLLGIPGPFLLGFLAGLGELIPNIGPVIGALPAVLFTLLAEPDKIFYVLGMLIVVQTIQSWTLSPMMMKFGVELPVLVTIISVLVFGMLFGFLGVLVAIPLVADMVVLWNHVNAYIDKDTTDYDEVNARAYGTRTPMSPDNTKPTRLRKLFRRSRRANPADAVPVAPAPAEASRQADGQEPAAGLSRLEEAEKKSVPKPAGNPLRP